MPGLYPILLDLTEKKCVVAGGGPVAERKVRGLLETGALIIVVAPEMTGVLVRLADEGLIRWERREATDADAEGAALLFAATNRPEVNRRLADAARLAGGWANVSDDGDGGDFMVPAVVRRGDLLLTASASGAGPSLAIRITEQLRSRYGEEYASYAQVLRLLRRHAKKNVPDRAERRKLLADAATVEVFEQWREAGVLQDPDPQPADLLAQLRDRAIPHRSEE